MKGKDSVLLKSLRQREEHCHIGREEGYSRPGRPAQKVLNREGEHCHIGWEEEGTRSGKRARQQREVVLDKAEGSTE